ncbi:hypothetical protein ACHAW6_015989 [Cyclotella cf. meneghiniana]
MKPLSTKLLFIFLSRKNTRRDFIRYRSDRINPIATFSSRAHEEFECERLFPPFDSELYDFYRKNFSSQRNRRIVPSLPKDNDARDTMYVLTRRSFDSQRKDIVVALRLTKSKGYDGYTFLRSLCCEKEHRRQGLALQMVRASLRRHEATTCCYCFASSELVGFYQKAGFVRIPPNILNDTMLNHTHVPKWLVHSFKSTANRWNQKGKSLELFLRYSLPKFPTRIVLLQHCSELAKSTATGWLVDDDLYEHSNGGTRPSVVPLRPRIQVLPWVWSGRNDTENIERQIQELASNSRLFLLWTGGSSIDEETKLNIESQTGSSVYLILDGTWQQAQTMFRKIPLLWNLPRISFRDVPSSKYILRKDYTGWRERFSVRPDGGGDLLCTAEAMAAVLDSREDIVGANEIRCRLDAFQINYPHIQALRKKDRQDWN